MGLFVFIFLFVIGELREGMDNFIRLAGKIEISKYFNYFLFKIPFMSMYMLPLAILFSISFLLGKMISSKELVISYTTGKSLSYFLIPIFLFVIILCILLHIFNESFIYKPFFKQKEIRDQFENQVSKVFQKRKDIILYGKKENIYIVESYFPKTQQLKNCYSIYFSPTSKEMTQVISFKTATYTNGQWHGEEIYTKDIINDSVSYLKKGILPIEENHDYFNQSPKFGKEYLSIKQTKEIADKRLSTGENSPPWFSEYYYKIALCYVSIFFLLMGIPMSKISKTSPIVVSIFFSILLAGVYWIALSLGKTLGASKIIDPIFAGWFANFIILLLTFILFRVFK